MEKKYSFLGVSLSILKALLYFGIWFLIQIAVTMVFTFVITLANRGATVEYIEKIAAAKTIEISIASNCITVLIFALIRKIRKGTLSEDASINKMPPRFVLNTVIMGVAFSYAVNLVIGVLGMIGAFPESWFTIQEDAYSYTVTATPVMQFLGTVIMAPILEEILFRGLILGTLKKEMHPWIAITVSSVIFGVAHGTPIGIIYATALGFLMGWLAVKFNSIIPSMIFHLAYNATVSYVENISLVVMILSIPIIIFEIIDINRFFRGNKDENL